MTGDGVNDAPASSRKPTAECRFGRDGRLPAADLDRLMTPGLTVIVDAIKESRKIFNG